MVVTAGALYKGFTRSHLERAFGVRFEDRGVVVPYRDRDGSTLREKLFSHEGKPLRWLGHAGPQPAYGLETFAAPRQNNVAFLTEGESCAWALRVAFPECPVLGVPGADSWKPDWARLFNDFEVVYLSFDNDEAGRMLVDKVWPFIPWARRVRLPEGRDTRDVLQPHGGMDAYEALLRDADYVAGATRYILEAAS